MYKVVTCTTWVLGSSGVCVGGGGGGVRVVVLMVVVISQGLSATCTYTKYNYINLS